MNTQSQLPAFLDQENYAYLKTTVADSIFKNTMKFMIDYTYCEKTNTGIENKKSKHVISAGIQSSNGTITKFDFYGDKFTKDIIPKNFKKQFKSLTEIQKAAVKVTVNECLKLFDENAEYQIYAKMILEAEGIKKLEDSKALQIIAHKILVGSIWTDQDNAYLGNPAYLKNWV